MCTGTYLVIESRSWKCSCDYVVLVANVESSMRRMPVPTRHYRIILACVIESPKRTNCWLSYRIAHKYDTPAVESDVKQIGWFRSVSDDVLISSVEVSRHCQSHISCSSAKLDGVGRSKCRWRFCLRWNSLLWTTQSACDSCQHTEQPKIWRYIILMAGNSAYILMKNSLITCCIGLGKRWEEWWLIHFVFADDFVEKSLIVPMSF